jgi:hypothetical protein
MNKTTIFLLMLVLSATTFGQQTNPPPPLEKQNFLTKSKKQKTAAWLLATGGTALMVTGFAIDSGEPEFNILCLCYVGSKDGTRGALILTGIAAIGGSIPLFIASGRNKRKAASLSLNKQFVPQINNMVLVNHAIPALNLKINL